MDKKESTIRGTIWSMVERFSTMGIQLICTLVIAQYLPPSEFGLISMMSIFLSFSMVIAEGGFGQAIIREQNVQPIDVSSLFYFNILTGIVIYLICFFAAPLISSFYRMPELTLLVRVSFLSIIVYSFAIVQGALLQKSVDFSKVSKVSLISVILSGVLGIGVAIVSRSVWALIIQSLSFAIFQTLFYWVFCKWRPALVYSWQSVRKYLSFSLSLLGSRMIAAIADNVANLFIGKAYTPTELGNYTVPDKLQRSVAGTISFAIHRVSYPVMSSFQNDVTALREYSQKIVGMAFYITAPIMLYLLIVAPQLFELILSPEWAKSAYYFRYMCIIGCVFCFADINLDILLVRGKSSLVLVLEIFRKTILVLSLLIGVMYSIKVLLVLLIGYNLFNTVLVCYYYGRELNYSLLQQFYAIIPTLIWLLLSTLPTAFIVHHLNGPFPIIVIAFLCFFTIYLLGTYLSKMSYPVLIVKTLRSLIMNRKSNIY